MSLCMRSDEWIGALWSARNGSELDTPSLWSFCLMRTRIIDALWAVNIKCNEQKKALQLYAISASNPIYISHKSANLSKTYLQNAIP